MTSSPEGSSNNDEVERQQLVEWRKRYFAKVREGIAAADNGDFATAEEIRAVADKYSRKNRPPFSP